MNEKTTFAGALTDKEVKAIEGIVSRGNTAEVERRKEGIAVYEVARTPVKLQPKWKCLPPRDSNKKARFEPNTIVIGGDEQSKIHDVIIPKIMQMNSNYVVVDLKGEILRLTGDALRNAGYNVRILNTNDLKNSMQYNPLSYLHNEHEIWRFACDLIHRDDSEDDIFKRKAAIQLVRAILLYLHLERPLTDQNMSELARLIEGCAMASTTDQLFCDLKKRKGASHRAVAVYENYKRAAGLVQDKILKLCTSRLAEFNMYRCSWEGLMDDEMALDKLDSQNLRTAIFIITSDTNTLFAPLARCLIRQVFQVQHESDKTHFPIHIVLNDFLSLGRMPDFVSNLYPCKDHELSATLLISQWDSLVDLYAPAVDLLADRFFIERKE